MYYTKLRWSIELHKRCACRYLSTLIQGMSYTTSDGGSGLETQTSALSNPRFWLHSVLFTFETTRNK